MFMVEPKNFDESIGQTLLTTNINIINFQSEQILTNQFHLTANVNDDEIPDEEVIIIDRIATDITMGSTNENRIHISTNMAMEHGYDIRTVDVTTVTFIVVYTILVVNSEKC